jgi:hypothetical protein
MTDWIVKLLGDNFRRLREAQAALTDDERRLLEYFWNRRKKEIRDRLSEVIINWFETDQHDKSMAEIIIAQTDCDMLSLRTKGYIESVGSRQPAVYSLTKQGVEYLKDRHPRIIAIWESFLESTPSFWTFIGTLVGLIASALGIYEFIFRR